MVLNTSNGPVASDRGRPGHVVNTSALVEEDMQYLDEEPEIIAVVPGAGWQAVVGGEVVALVAWVAMDDATMYGVAVGEDGKVDLTENNVEKLPGFSGYKQATNELQKENL